MPSKNYNGNARPLGEPIKVKGGNLQGAIGGLEAKVAKLQPAQSLDTGMLQLPNGRVHVPRRVRAVSGSGAKCTPWKPTMINTSETDVPNYKIRLAPGTINGAINSSWNDLVDVTDPVDPDDLNYIIATVTFTDKQVTSISYTVIGNLPSGNELNPVTLESLPSSIKIILGTLVGTTSCMIWDTNILITGVEVFQETIANPAENTKPYNSWYSYQLTPSA